MRPIPCLLRSGDNLNLPLPDAEASTNLKVASLSMIVIAPGRLAIDEKVAAAVPADLAERHRGECYALAGRHDVQS